MDHKHRTIELFTSQADEVVRKIYEDGIYYVKYHFISQKYGAVKDIFLKAYQWYTSRASQIVEKPKEADSAVWTYLDRTYVEKHPGSSVIKLSVPIDEVVFFRMSDWNKILNLRYLGCSREEEQSFSDLLERNGVSYEGDVYLTPYYPSLKHELVKSWERLFQFDPLMKAGQGIAYEDMQAGIWCIKKEWIDDKYQDERT